MSIKDNLHEIYLEFSHFFKKVYPDFITSGKTGKLQGVPVFTFHTVKPEIFKEQLEFLRENNYNTIGPDDLYNYLTGKSNTPERSILLTFDDGRRSVWTYGFPLLKKYGFKATVFVIPGHTKEVSSEFRVQSDINSDNISEVESKNKDEEILSWQEIRIMNGSGIIDFGSHTLYHHKIFTGSEIIDFLCTGQKILSYDYPGVPAGYETALFERDPVSFFGMPIYINDSPMSGKPRFVDDEKFRDECMKYFRERFDRETFFYNENRVGRLDSTHSGSKRSPDLPLKWEKEMISFASDYRKRNHVPDRFSNPEETAKEIYDNLSISKKILEEKLGKPVDHLCYPFGIWSPLSQEMAKRAGYLSSFCAYIPGRPINMPGDDPYKIVRLKDDYIFRLPGKGRKSLTDIFLHKFKRRLKGERAY